MERGGKRGRRRRRIREKYNNEHCFRKAAWLAFLATIIMMTVAWATNGGLEVVLNIFNDSNRIESNIFKETNDSLKLRSICYY